MSDDSFTGSLAQIAVYRQALTAQQVFDHYSAANAEMVELIPTIAGNVASLPSGTAITGGHPNWTDGVFRLRWQAPLAASGHGDFSVQFGSSDVSISIDDTGVCTTSLGVAGDWAQIQNFPADPNAWYWLILTNQGTTSSYIIATDQAGAPDPSPIVSGAGVFVSRPPRPIQIAVTDGPVLFGGAYDQVCTVYPSLLPADWLMVNGDGWQQVEPAFCWDQTEYASGGHSLSIQSGAQAGSSVYWVTESPDEWDAIPATPSMPYRFTGSMKVMGDTVGPLYCSVVLTTQGLRSYYRLDDDQGGQVTDIGPAAEHGQSSGAALTGQGQSMLAADGNAGAVLMGGQLSYPQPAPGDAWSWECWFMAPAGASGELVSWGDDGGVLEVDQQGKLAFAPLRSPARVDDGQPHYAAVCSDGSTLTLYLDGQAVDSYTLQQLASIQPLEVPLSYPQVVQATPDLMYYWRLGGAGPTYVDEAAGMVGTATGPAFPQTVAGLVADDDGALAFGDPANVSNSRVQANGLGPIGNAWTFSFIFSSTDTTGLDSSTTIARYLAAWSVATSPRFYWNASSSNGCALNVYVANVANSPGSAAGLPFAGQWGANTYSPPFLDGEPHLVTVTWDGTFIRGYIDGVERNSANWSAMGGLNLDIVGSLLIGYGGGVNGGVGLATIDEFAIFARALTAGEVANLYAAMDQLDVLDSIVVSGLDPDEEHTFTVRALNASGEGAPATATATPWALPLPDATVTSGAGTSVALPVTLDELAFYDVALDADTVLSHYQASAALGPGGAGWFEVLEWDGSAPPNLLAVHPTPGPTSGEEWGQVETSFITEPTTAYLSVRCVLGVMGTVWFDLVNVLPDQQGGAVANVADSIRVLGPPAQSVFHLAGDHGQNVVPLFFGTYSKSQEGGPQVTVNFDVTQIPLFNVAQPITRTGAIKWRQIQFNAMFLSPPSMAAYNRLRDMAYSQSVPFFYRDQSGRMALMQQSPQNFQIQHEPSNYRRRYDLQNTLLEVPNTVSPHTRFAYVVGRRALVNGTLPPLDLTEEA